MNLIKIYVVGALAILACQGSAFAECRDKYIYGSIEELRGEMFYSGERVPEGIKAAQVLTSQLILDYAPMSEDFGPETVGPYTLSKIVSAYIEDSKRSGRILTKATVDKNIQFLEQICEQVDKERMQLTSARADVVAIAANLERYVKLAPYNDRAPASFQTLASDQSDGAVAWAFAAFGFLLLSTAGFVFYSITFEQKKTRALPIKKQLNNKQHKTPLKKAA
jgi:hypothetical protein